MPIDNLDLMADPSGGQMLPYDDPGMMPEGDIAAPAVQTGPGAFDHQRLIENIQNPNIAEDLDEDVLSSIGQKVRREHQIDLDTRSDWERESREAMDLAMQVAEEKTFPWPKASNIIYPALTVAAIQFAARSYPAIVQGRNVVKGVVTGADDGQPMINQATGQPYIQNTPKGPQPVWLVAPGAKGERAKRIGEHMSWQLLDEITEWEEETDKMLHALPIIGCCFRKSLYDPSMGCNASMLVLAQNLVINYHAKSMERAPRLTEHLQFYPYEIEEQVRAGLFLDLTYDASGSGSQDEDAPREFLEQHRWWDLDEDGYPEPYIVTIHKETGKVARIVARYDAEGVHLSRTTKQIAKIEPIHFYTKYDFLPNPDGGIYGVGFGKLLGPINRAVNTTLNQMFDAGSLQVTGGGFIGRGPSLHAGSLRFKLGEWKQVNVPGQTLKESIVPFNHPGPNAVMFSLLGMMIDAGKEVASVKDILAGDVNAQTMQPTTLLALIEQGLKVFTGIFKRVNRSLKKELDKLYRLNRIYLQNESRYQVGEEWRTIRKDDYAEGGGVRPVADPTMVSDMQRMARAQFLQSYQNDPNIKRVEVIKRIFAAADIEKPDELINEENPPNPQILAATADLELKGEKTKADVATAKATQMEKLSAAVLNLAKADKENESVRLEDTAQYIKLLEIQMNALLQPADDRGQGGPGQAQPPPGPPEQPPGLDQGAGPGPQFL
jgi:chaperonin GroES